MKKFTEYKQLNLNAVAENVANFWKTNQTFKKSVETRSERNCLSGRIYPAGGGVRPDPASGSMGIKNSLSAANPVGGLP